MDSLMGMIRHRLGVATLSAFPIVLGLGVVLGCGSKTDSGASSKNEMPEFAKNLKSQMEERAATQKAAQTKKSRGGPAGRR